MTTETKQDLRYAVSLAVRYWPNAHLGNNSPREDIASAFQIIRNRLKAGWSIQQAIGALESDAYRHADM